MPNWLRLTAVGMIRSLLAKGSFALPEIDSNNPWQQYQQDEKFRDQLRGDVEKVEVLGGTETPLP